MPIDSSDTTGPSFATRRKLLQERERSWKYFTWRNRHTLELPAHGSIYEFIGGFYASVIPPLISFIELPSLVAGSDSDAPGRTWVHTMPDLSIVDFTMDPSQDLLILLTNALPEYAALTQIICL